MDDSRTLGQLSGPARSALVVLLIYVFLVGVSSLETGIKIMGEDTQERLFSTVSNPLAALCVGVLSVSCQAPLGLHDSDRIHYTTVQSYLRLYS